MEKYIEYLVTWLQQTVKEAKAKGLVVGVSGGIDSAVCAHLIKRAFPDQSLGLILPCYSNPQDVEHALLVVKHAQLKHNIIELNTVYDSLIRVVEPTLITSESYILAKANTKSRLRMTTLYATAQNNNYLVCGTDNACEWFTGYFTKYGDGGVDLAPLIHLTKSQVYQIAKYLEIPEEIIQKAPTPGLIAGVNDESEMQVTYAQLEKYLAGEVVEHSIKARIEHLHQSSSHKRRGISIPEQSLGELDD